MEDDYFAAQKRERRAKSIPGRRAKWMNAEWKLTSNGNPRINRNGFIIVVSQSYDRWRYWIKEREGERERSQTGFASEEAAKLAAFECFIELQE